MTTEKAPTKTKIFRRKKGADEDVIAKMRKMLDKKFPKREIDVKISYHFSNLNESQAQVQLYKVR